MVRNTAGNVVCVEAILRVQRWLVRSKNKLSLFVSWATPYVAWQTHAWLDGKQQLSPLVWMCIFLRWTFDSCHVGMLLLSVIFILSILINVLINVKLTYIELHYNHLLKAPVRVLNVESSITFEFTVCRKKQKPMYNGTKNI